MAEKNKPMVGEFVLARFNKKVTQFGTSAHIPIGKEYIGSDAEITIKKKWMICQRCSETFIDTKEFSPDSKYCNNCYDALKFLEKKKGKLKCEKCGEKMSEEEYKYAWNEEICQKCWNEKAEKESKANGDTSERLALKIKEESKEETK